MLITPLFAALFGLLYVALSLYVVSHRFSKKISIGSGGDKATEMAMRAHANFIEYVPLALILFYFIEVISLSSTLVFVMACTLLFARVAHIIGMLKPAQWLILRQLGSVLTFTVIIIVSVSLALRYIPISV